MTATYGIWPYNCVDAMLHLIDEGSIHCAVTSPPYFGLRNYGTSLWAGGDPACDHKPTQGWVQDGGDLRRSAGMVAGNQAKARARAGGACRCGAIETERELGHEPTPDEYVARLVQVARAVRRVLRDDGTFWLNLGDSYASNPKGPGGQDKSTLTNGGAYERTASRIRAKPRGIAAKQLLGIPWRVAFALQADGWFLRQAIVWHKSNPMPESVRDRCTRSYEHIFMFSKSPRYFYDAAAIAEPAIYGWRGFTFHEGKTGEHQLGRSQKVRASVPQGGFGGKGPIPGSGQSSFRAIRDMRNKRDVWTVSTKPFKGAHFATFPPDLIEPCILAGCPAGGTVLDPFGGSGTTAVVALRHGRNAVLCELNPEYVEMAHVRIAVAPMLAALVALLKPARRGRK